MAKLRLLLPLLVALTLVGCAAQLPEHTASFETITTLRRANVAGVSVGTFKLADGKPSQMDTEVAARLSRMTPFQGSLSAYLKDALVTELKAAGKYDPDANISISGELIESALNADMRTANATLGVRFRVQDAQHIRFDRVVTVRAEWASSYVGAVAVPKAYLEYLALYKQLFLELFADPDFIQATRSAR